MNAFKRKAGYYDEETVRRIETVDPLFRISLQEHDSGGRICRCGSTVFSVAGDGAVRRCHFDGEVLGNLYETPLSSLPRRRRCRQSTCRCHIGYAHLEYPRLDRIFGDGILERVR